MVISETPIESHAVHRDRLIDHARRMLRDGDRIQACEKIWGAAAHGLKVVADHREWPYTTHSDGRIIASHLGKLTGNRDIPRLFGYLEGLHRSFYADSFSLQEIEERLPDADEFLRLIEAADRSVPLDAPMPDAPSTSAAAPSERRASSEPPSRAGGRLTPCPSSAGGAEAVLDANEFRRGAHDAQGG